MTYILKSNKQNWFFRIYHVSKLYLDMANKIKFKIKSDKFSDFINKLEDLTKISDTIKLKIDNDNILMYSMLGGNVMLAFKNYLINTRDYLEYGDDMEYSMDVIIANAKKFVKNLNFIKESDKITLEISYKESQDDDTVMSARSLQIVGGKLKVNWISGEHYEMRDINKVALSQRLNLKNRKWAFAIEKSDFSDVKKLSSINGERIINIGVVEGKVLLSERAAWEMEIGSIESTRSANLILNKKFLSCINDSVESIEFSIFDTFMLVKDEYSNLMLSFEQDFEDED
jgi:hypothetical protein